MLETIKLMPDYFCYPLWWENSDRIGNIDPASLALSAETIEGLNRWATRYDATLNTRDPANSSGFGDRAEKEEFDREGVRLWLQLRQELKNQYEVVYFHKHLQKLFVNPRELEEFGIVPEMQKQESFQ
jgi:hypothetical protein